MPMGPTEIYHACKDLEKMLIDKGYVSPEVGVRIPGFFEQHGFLSITYYIPNDSGANDRNALPSIQIEMKNDVLLVDDAIGKAFSVVHGIESVSDARMCLFRRKFAAVLEEARKMDFPVDFINPLEETMKRLSENVIEHKSE